MEIAFATDRGLRRENNEDALKVIPEKHIYLVADGVGGNNSGEVASRIAVQESASYIENNPIGKFENLKDVSQYFGDMIDVVNSAVREESLENPELEGMATTLVGVYFIGSKMYVMNVGDSRVYLYRDNAMLKLTEDHSYVNALLRAGIITEDEAKNHENRNMITRAIGAEACVRPDFYEFGIKPGDVVVLCSDGLYEEVTREQMAYIISHADNLDSAAEECIRQANQFGGYDNITLICLRITEDDINE